MFHYSTLGETPIVNLNYPELMEQRICPTHSENMSARFGILILVPQRDVEVHYHLIFSLLTHDIGAILYVYSPLRTHIF